MPNCLFIAQYAATLFMTGLIWFVQIVHYPLFATVLSGTSLDGFRIYETRHARRTGFVVFTPMTIELLAALAALMPSLRPVFLPQTAAVTSAIFVVIIWSSTGLIQVPHHNHLSTRPDPEMIRSLTGWNWLRTVLWTARALLLSYYLVCAIR